MKNHRFTAPLNLSVFVPLCIWLVATFMYWGHYPSLGGGSSSYWLWGRGGQRYWPYFHRPCMYCRPCRHAKVFGLSVSVCQSVNSSLGGCSKSCMGLYLSLTVMKYHINRNFGLDMYIVKFSIFGTLSQKYSICNFRKVDSMVLSLSNAHIRCVKFNGWNPWRLKSESVMAEVINGQS